ncbi:hypothetical protein S83_054209 [Arachis hypogaea]
MLEVVPVNADVEDVKLRNAPCEWHSGVVSSNSSVNLLAQPKISNLSKCLEVSSHISYDHIYHLPRTQKTKSSNPSYSSDSKFSSRRLI